MATTSPAREQTLITVVHSPACHFCEDARLALAELGEAWPITVELVECSEPRGAALVREHRAAMYPLVLVDGAYFSSGRLPRKKLAKLLITRAAAAVA